MTAIWRKDNTGWQLLAPAGFPDERSLHTLVEQAPHILPLSGSPRLVVVGREVGLGNGSADLLAIESSGRMVIIEVKLSRNAEVRRAVVAQVLAYAAYLKGVQITTLEQSTLARHLRERGYESLSHAVSANDQEGSIDVAAFSSGLTDSLALGSFRLVLVVDEAPEELVRLVGYLESVTDKLVIDLVTVSSYEISGSQVLVPQRVEPAHEGPKATLPVTTSEPQHGAVEGSEGFETAAKQAPEPYRTQLLHLTHWAQTLEREGLAKLWTYFGRRGGMSLLPYLKTENVGLITIYNDKRAYVQFWRSVFERRAPGSITRVEGIIAPAALGQGNWIPETSDELLTALTEAYREAARGRLQ